MIEGLLEILATAMWGFSSNKMVDDKVHKIGTEILKTTKISNLNIHVNEHIVMLEEKIKIDKDKYEIEYERMPWVSTARDNYKEFIYCRIHFRENNQKQSKILALYELAFSTKEIISVLDDENLKAKFISEYRIKEDDLFINYEIKG